TVTTNERGVTDLVKTLDATDTTDKAHSTALLEQFWKRDERGDGVLRPEYRTVITIRIADFSIGSCGNVDEVILGVSDGLAMTGAELINAALSGALGEKLYAGLFHPTAGPVNLYEARFASLKQRIMATAENLVCPWPDCNVPADRCQVHHIDAHRNGGHTTP